MNKIVSYFNDFTHLIFPHHCEGCGTDVLQNNQLLCAECLHQLPITNFTATTNNPIEKIFYGRLNIVAATAGFYFSKQSLMQHLLHQLKYKGNKDVGLHLGKLLGQQLKASNRFNDIDIIVPLPLNYKREFKRGYNQATLICEGVAEVFNKPIATDALVRTVFTETQTTNTRINRWENMDGVFKLNDEAILQNKHVLLIDDIITTGATLEACGKTILSLPNTTVSIATVAYTI